MPSFSNEDIDLYFEDEGYGGPTLLIHGAFASGERFGSVVQTLARSRRVVVPDLRGWGRSQHVELVRPGDWDRDLLELLDHLGIDEFHVIGCSLGARVATRLAADHPGRVKSVVSDWTILSADEAASRALTQDGQSMSESRRLELAAMHGDDWEEVLASYFRSRSSPGFQEYYDVRSFADRVECPVFISRGDAHDVKHPLSHSFELRELIERSCLWIAPATPGSAMREHPDEFVRHYDTFLCEYLGEPA